MAVSALNAAGPSGGRYSIDSPLVDPVPYPGLYSGNIRLWASNDGDDLPLITPGQSIYMQLANYSAAWRCDQWNGETLPWVNRGQDVGNHSYFGSRPGYGPSVFNTGALGAGFTEKIVPYETFIQNGRQHIRFWAFSNAVGPITDLSVQILIKDRSPGTGTKLTDMVGTVHSVVAGGTYNAVDNRMDDVVQDQSGGGLHEIVWDRAADGVPIGDPDFDSYATLFMFQAP